MYLHSMFYAFLHNWVNKTKDSFNANDLWAQHGGFTNQVLETADSLTLPPSTQRTHSLKHVCLFFYYFFHLHSNSHFHVLLQLCSRAWRGLAQMPDIWLTARKINIQYGDSQSCNRHLHTHDERGEKFLLNTQFVGPGIIAMKLEGGWKNKGAGRQTEDQNCDR